MYQPLVLFYGAETWTLLAYQITVDDCFDKFSFCANKPQYVYSMYVFVYIRSASKHQL